MSGLVGNTLMLNGVQVTVNASRGTSESVYEVVTDRYGPAVLKVGTGEVDELKQRRIRQEVKILDRLVGHGHDYRAGTPNGRQSGQPYSSCATDVV